jgi:hypothetical protein
MQKQIFILSLILLVSLFLGLTGCAANDPLNKDFIFSKEQHGLVPAPAFPRGYVLNDNGKWVPLESATGGINLEWLGDLASPPGSPEEGQGYHNTTNGTSYIYCNSAWQVFSQDGAEGPPGDDGPPGEDGDPGQGFTWKGVWVSGTSYSAYDIVYYNGSSYNCILATSGTTTPDQDPTHWTLMAVAGIRAVLIVSDPSNISKTAIMTLTNVVGAPDREQSTSGKLTSSYGLVYN